MILAMPRYAFLASLLLLLTACGDAPPGEASPFGADVDPTALAYAPELGIDFDTMERTDAGVYWRDEVVGEGEEAGGVIPPYAVLVFEVEMVNVH
jgi:hypothetical protein